MASSAMRTFWAMDQPLAAAVLAPGLRSFASDRVKGNHSLSAGTATVAFGRACRPPTPGPRDFGAISAVFCVRIFLEDGERGERVGSWIAVHRRLEGCARQAWIGIDS